MQYTPTLPPHLKSGCIRQSAETRRLRIETRPVNHCPDFMQTALFQRFTRQSWTKIQPTTIILPLADGSD